MCRPVTVGKYRAFPVVCFSLGGRVVLPTVAVLSWLWSVCLWRAFSSCNVSPRASVVAFAFQCGLCYCCCGAACCAAEYSFLQFLQEFVSGCWAPLLYHGQRVCPGGSVSCWPASCGRPESQTSAPQEQGCSPGCSSVLVRCQVRFVSKLAQGCSHAFVVFHCVVNVQLK